jgi:hypothetical protein
MVTCRKFRIDESLRRLAEASDAASKLPTRREFRDPLIVSFQGCQLSSVIDEELERFYNPSGPVELITRVFRRFRRSEG